MSSPFRMNPPRFTANVRVFEILDPQMSKMTHVFG
nr:MAG TPA: hypothetical protein [Caudoviricetes sp.]